MSFHQCSTPLSLTPHNLSTSTGPPHFGARRKQTTRNDETQRPSYSHTTILHWVYTAHKLNNSFQLIQLTLFTYSMVQSPSWEANWFAASQEIPRNSQNQKVHYRTHKRPPPVSILGQPNPVHIPTSHLLEIHLNVIHPSTPRSPQWAYSANLQNFNKICTSDSQFQPGWRSRCSY